MIKKSVIWAGHTRRVPGYSSSRFIPLCFISVVLLAFVMPVYAGATTVISQSYSTSDELSLGSIVSLEDNYSDQVVAATSSNTENLLGVVIDAGDSLLSLTNSKGNQVQIATSGTVQVLVSDINGTVSSGDNITASPISGVGMKATTNAKIIGIAQGDLNTGNGSQQSYTDKNGTKHTVFMGQIPLLVSVSSYFKEPDKTLVPQAIQNLANALAGRQVSTLPILISSAIFIVTLIVVVSIIYSMIRSSIISVGRNPMSQSAIYRNLIQLSALVLVILSVSMMSIYLVLTRM